MNGPADIPYIELIKRFKAKTIFFHELKGRGRRLAIRHDVDHDIDKAISMARFESLHEISSTYFLLPTARYFDYTNAFLAKCKTLTDLRHRIGFHNNAVTMWYKSSKPILNIVKKPIRFLRQAGFKIDFSSSHGSFEGRKLGFRNFDVWSESHDRSTLGNPQISLRDVGLKNEVYFMPFTFYLSESGAKWRGGMLNGHKSWFEQDFPFLNQEKVYKQVDKFAKFERASAQLLVHPKWWPV